MDPLRATTDSTVFTDILARVSEQNVEVMRRVVEAAGNLDVLAALLHEDWEYRPVVAGTSTGAVYRGFPEGFRQYWADLEDAWERHDVSPEQFVDLHDNGVLVIFRLEARGRTSGVELALDAAVHCLFKDGKLWRSIGYDDVDKARRAVGLT
jgi:ketosteroid isomerase-like protein